MLNGHNEMPSWYRDKNKLQLFVKGVTFNALRKGANKQNVDAALVITGDTHAVLKYAGCLLYTSPSPRDRTRSRMPSSA